MSKKLLTGLSILLIVAMVALVVSHVRWPSEKGIVMGKPISFQPPVLYQPVQGEGLVRVNTASLEELMTLNGIGKKTAQKIIEERKANGFFYFPEDLRSVSGIGEKTLRKIEDSICFE